MAKTPAKFSTSLATLASLALSPEVRFANLLVNLCFHFVAKREKKISETEVSLKTFVI